MTTQVSTQQVLAQAMVGAMAVNIMASAMYVMMGTISASEFKVPMTELKGTQAAVHELKLAFGADVVDKAVKNVGTVSMVALAQEVERVIVEDMTSKYGAQATESALAAAPLGDVATARQIASLLAGRGIKPKDMEAWLRGAPAQQKAQVVEGAKKRVKMKAKPVLDTKTGIQYKSKSAAGMTVAAEYGLDSTNTFIWYEVIKKDPNRFKEIGMLSPGAPISPASAYTPPKALSPAPSKSLSIREAMKKYEEEAAGPSTTWTTAGKQSMVDRVLPEWKQVLNNMSMMDIPGNKLLKPRKFIEKITIIPTPAGFNPSAQGDYAYTHSYSYTGGRLIEGPSYSYESMMNVVGSPYERTVDVPKGTRVWVCTWDGQWGGYWSRVDVYVNPDDMIGSPGLKRLQEGKMHGEA